MNAIVDERNGDWMQTATGREFWPIDPRRDEVYIEDIAHSLANMCRFAGHCREFYSVAQHSILVSASLPVEHKLWGLMHDASEAYVVDVPRPIKPFISGYQEAEDRVMRVIADRFGLSMPIPEAVKRADTAILADEAAQIMLAPPRAWRLPYPPLGIDIDPWSPATARRRFLEEFASLTATVKEGSR